MIQSDRAGLYIIRYDTPDHERRFFMQSIEFDPSRRILSVFLYGEIDHHSAREMREKTDIAAGRYRPKLVVLDFSGVTFMDSSGVGLVMGRYRLAQENDFTLLIANPSESIRKLMLLAGLDRLVRIVQTAHTAADTGRGR